MSRVRISSPAPQTPAERSGFSIAFGLPARSLGIRNPYQRLPASPLPASTKVGVIRGVRFRTGDQGSLHHPNGDGAWAAFWRLRWRVGFGCVDCGVNASLVVDTFAGGCWIGCWDRRGLVWRVSPELTSELQKVPCMVRTLHANTWQLHS
jgi:hypothetical protein